MQIISREAAKAAGLKRYFTGRPCKRGHIDERQIANFGCMACQRENAAKWFCGLQGEKREARRDYERQRWQNPEFRERHRRYQQQEHEREKQAHRNREWKKRNREKLARKSREWYHANSEYALERQKAYVATRPIELRRQLGRKSRSKRRAIELQVFVEVVDARVVFERDKGQCGICGEPVDPMSRWEVDHIVPISKGGAHAYANVQLAHRQCNRAKGAKTSRMTPM